MTMRPDARPAAVLSGAISELEALAAFVHGSVAFGNVLGVLFNLRRRQWRWCALHVAGVVFHVMAAKNHARPVKAAALVLALLLTVPAAAQEFKVCRVSGRAVWTNRVPCDEIVQYGYHCDAVSGLPHCTPPTKMTYAPSPPHLRVEVTFGGEFIWQGQTYWRWMRGGQVHYVSPRFFLRTPQ